MSFIKESFLAYKQVLMNKVIESKEVDLEETTFEKIYQMQQDGKSLEDIAKELKLKPDLVKKVLGEQVELIEFTDAMLADLKKEYDPLKGKTITTSRYQQLKNMLFKLKDGDLEKLQKQNIPFASTGAGSILRVRKAPRPNITSVKVPGLEGMAEETLPVMSGSDSFGYNVKYKAKKSDQKISVFYSKEKNLAQKFLDDIKKTGGNGITTAKEEVELQEKPSIKQFVVFHSDSSPTKHKEFKAYDETELNKQIGEFLKQNPGYKVYEKSPSQSVKETFKDNIVKKLVKPIQDFNKKKEEPKKEEVQLKEKQIDTKDLIKTIKDLNIDDLQVSDDKNFIHIVKEFDNTIDNMNDVKSQYMDIVKTLNKKGINYKQNSNQDIEKNQDYIQINFSVKKEAVDNPYAIGMAVAMKSTGDMPPLKKSTITKAHKIADKVKKESHYKVGQTVTYRGPTTDAAVYKSRKVKILSINEPQIGAYYKIQLSPTLITYVSPDELKEENQGAKLVYESIVGLKNKAEKSGMPYSILKQVFNRGMAAWKGGHRPGVGQQQWAFARVNSFITKSSGTWGGADKDLASKVKGS